MKIKIGQIREIADILLQVHANKKVIMLWFQMGSRKGCMWGMFVVYQS